MEFDNIAGKYNSPREFFDALVNSKNGSDAKNLILLQPFIADFLEKCWSVGFDKFLNSTSFWSSDVSETAWASLARAVGNREYVEVPADQYDKIISLIEEKGNSLAEFYAKSYFKKSNLTYTQVKNIAKAGNIDSLMFDIKNNIVTTGFFGGMTFLISFARYRWSGLSEKDALTCSLSDAIQIGGIAMLTSVCSSQIMRTPVASALTKMVRPGVKAIYKSSGIGKTAIEKLAEITAGKTLHGAAAINSVSRLLRSNIITSCVSTAVITAPDFYRAAVSGSISWAQFGKNLCVNGVGGAGGAGGWIGGAAAGAAAGSIVPGIGTAVGGIIGGVLGALAGGTIASTTVKKGMDYLVKDDSEEMLEILQKVFEQLCYDFLLSEDEVKKVSGKLNSVINESWLRDMYKQAEYSRNGWVYSQLESLFESVIRERPKVSIPEYEDFGKVIDELSEAINEYENKEKNENLYMLILEELSKNKKKWFSGDIISDNIISLDANIVKNILDELYISNYVERRFEDNEFVFMITQCGCDHLLEYNKKKNEYKIKSILEVFIKNDKKWISCDFIKDNTKLLTFDEIKNELDELHQSGYISRKFEGDDFLYTITETGNNFILKYNN